MLYSAKSAVISECKKYRYRLGRTWDEDRDRVMWIMCNPSTADALMDDRTISRVTVFSNRWGFGGLSVVNLFAFRSTYPAVLSEMKREEAIGDENDSHIKAVALKCHYHMAAWSAYGSLYGRGGEVRKMLKDMGIVLNHLGLTKNQQPKHPLRLHSSTERVPLD